MDEFNTTNLERASEAAADAYLFTTGRKPKVMTAADADLLASREHVRGVSAGSAATNAFSAARPIDDFTDAGALRTWPPNDTVLTTRAEWTH